MRRAYVHWQNYHVTQLCCIVLTGEQKGFKELSIIRIAAYRVINFAAATSLSLSHCHRIQGESVY